MGIRKHFYLNIETFNAADHHCVKEMCSDGKRDYISMPFLRWLKKYGVVHEVTIAYSSESNGAAERSNRTIWDMGQTMPHNLEKRNIEL